MKKLFRKNEVVKFKNEKQKKQLLGIAVKYGIKWRTGILPYEKEIIKDSNCICFHKGLYITHDAYFDNLEMGYKVISTKKFLKRFKEEEQVSGWYKWDDTEYLMYHDFEKGTKFGFDTIGMWHNKVIGLDMVGYPKATDEEVLQRLTEEAKRRGFVSGVSIRCLSDNEVCNDASEDYFFDKNSKKTFYNEFCLDQILIMKDGQWAEVAEEEVYEPKVGDFGLFWDDSADMQEENRIGYIKEINTKYFCPYRCINGEAFDNFKPLPKEIEDMYNSIKNK